MSVIQPSNSTSPAFLFQNNHAVLAELKLTKASKLSNFQTSKLLRFQLSEKTVKLPLPLSSKKCSGATQRHDCVQLSVKAEVIDKSDKSVHRRDRRFGLRSCCYKEGQFLESTKDNPQKDFSGGSESLEKKAETVSLGVKAALVLLRFYKAEISPLLPGSCRYVPTCSEYGMEAFKRYGVFKGSILTAWRLARCNPFGGSGFDPPRWFGEPRPPSY